ncbi:ABC transporter permease [Arthrobacter bambusae]|uniref:ABC transporter permease n=1 Tax=Arthrobacter bambusae TaxID=1338426 RepID=UPI0027885CB6|nr:ABC transporter permease [Arthrobacter bambusae]MDQ0239547.1 ABC-type nitrate/sulfonate/bicarbonate transport system permease component [Arthrobacter bambusae]
MTSHPATNSTSPVPGGSRSGSLLVEIWLPVLAVALWWVAGTDSQSIYFPPLQKIVGRIGELLSTRFLSDIAPSLQNFGSGLLIAVVVGMGTGLALGLVPRLYTAVQPILEFLRAVPGVAILPVMLFIFGIGSSMKVAVIAFGALWPILLNTVDGVRGVDGLVREVSRSYRLRAREYIFRVLLPAASPQIISGIRLSVSLGVILIVASEYIASTEGIGYVELQSSRLFQMDVMWAALLILGVLGYAANILFRFVEHIVLRWHRGARGSQGGQS